MTVRLNWSFIAGLVAFFVGVLAIGAAIYSRSMTFSAPVLTDPEFNGAPLDFADETTRRSILSHLEEMQGSTMYSIATRCARGDEIYRAYAVPGLSLDDFRIVEARVSGSVITIREYATARPSAPPQRPFFGWRLVHEHTFDALQLTQVRAALTAALKISAPAAVEDRVVDSSTLIVETCRQSRYHYFERHVLAGKGAGEINDLAQSIFRLADQPAGNAGRH